MVPVVAVPRKFMSTAPVSHLAYHKNVLAVPDCSVLLSGKCQCPSPLPLPPSVALGGVPQQATSSVTQYSASSSSPMTDGSLLMTPWLGNTAPFRARPAPVRRNLTVSLELQQHLLSPKNNRISKSGHGVYSSAGRALALPLQSRLAVKVY